MVWFLLHPVVGMFYCNFLLIVDRIFFHCFGMSCFLCIVLPYVDISLIFFLSPVLSGLFPQVLLLVFPVLSLLFRSQLFQRLSFVSSFLPVLVDFLSEFLVEIPIRVLIFLSCFLRGSQFSHKLISLLHKLVHLIRLFYSLIYKSVLDSLHLYLP